MNWLIVILNLLDSGSDGRTAAF